MGRNESLRKGARGYDSSLNHWGCDLYPLPRFLTTGLRVERRVELRWKIQGLRPRWLGNTFNLAPIHIQVVAES